MIVGLLVACEVVFWALLLFGLSLRYVVRARRLSSLVLACVPLVDLVLVAAAAADLLRGTIPGQPHLMAAVYLGFGVAFGPAMLRWADVRFAHRFAGGPAPVKALPHQRQKHLWSEWFHVVGAVALASMIDGLLSLCTRQPLVLWQAAGAVWVVAGIWLVAGPLWQVGSDKVSHAGSA